MASFLKRTSGLVAAIVGVVGTALAVLAIFHTWKTQQRLHREIPEAFAHANHIVESVRQQGQATSALLETTRVHLDSVRGPIAQLAQQNQRLDNTVILQTLDSQIVRQLESVEHFSLSMQNSMRGMSSALLIMDSMPFLGGGLARKKDETGQWKTVATNLTDTANLLEQVSQTLASIRSGQNVSPEQIRQLADSLNKIDVRLQTVQTHIAQFNRTVDESNAYMAGVTRRAPLWIERSAILITVFFTCFAFSQLSLLWLGGKALFHWR